MKLVNVYETRERDSFGSNMAFYMAAVGSAVGFGNVWRFPGLCAQYGGAAFLIPYTLALILIGIPILFLEIGFGQFHQTGDVGVFGSINMRLRGVGMCSVLAAFILLTYYSALISWCWNAFFDSFGKNTPWQNEDLDSDGANSYFFNRIVGMETVNDGYATRIVWANLGYSLLTWVIVYISIAFGSKWTGRITYFTMGFPFLLLFVFLFRGISLEGADEGIAHYIGSESDFTVLSSKPSIWTEAVTQIFFSLGITMGVMTAFGSHVPRTEPAFKNSVIIACINCGFSFIAGFAVFSAMGHLAFLKDVGVTDIKSTSFSLVFGTWPVVLGSLPGGIHWIRLLFLTLILLGIDSAFAILEAVVTVMHDTSYLKDEPKWVVTAVFATLGFICSLIFITDGGLFFLDTIDYYINFMLLIVGFLETFSVGWMYGLEKQVEKVGAPAVFCFMFANFGGAVVSSGLWFGLKNTRSGFVSYVLIYGVSLGVATALMEPKVECLSSGFYTLFWGNVADIRDELQPVVGWVPNAWCFLIKHFVPQILLILFINGSTAPVSEDNDESKFGNYGDYEFWPYQFLGIISVVLISIIFLLGVFFPDFYKSFAIYEKSGEEFSTKAKTLAKVEEGALEPEKVGEEKPLEEEPLEEKPVEEKD